jgi:competence protein ComEC
VITSIAFLVGILIFSTKTYLTIGIVEMVGIVICSIVALILIKRYRTTSFAIIIMIAGYLWSFVVASMIFTHQVPQQFHNNYVQTTGVIASLIDSNTTRDRFILQTSKPFIATLRVSVYGPNRPTLKVGQEWQWNLKIKTNNSYQNEASFDYEKWLFMNKIDATAWTTISKPYQFIGNTSAYPFHQLREHIQHTLQSFTKNLEFSGLISALLIGEKSAISAHHKDILRDTGTSHLSVISGLHLGIVASSVFLLGTLIFSRLPVAIRTTPVVIPVALSTIIATFIYMGLAGFSTPTVRAFIMIAVVMIAIIYRHNIFKWRIYFVALGIVLLVHPFSVLEVGFWLSFIASGIIVYFVNFNSTPQSLSHKIWHIVYLQIMISIVMSPVVVWFFGEFSIVSPIANIISIPIFSIIIVPLSFVALIVSFIPYADSVASMIFIVIDTILHYNFAILAYLQTINANMDITALQYGELAVLFIGIVFIFLPRALLLQPLGVIIISAILLTDKPTHNHLYMLDVGQGSAAIFAIGNTAVVFDVGNKFNSGFSLGKVVVMPFLRLQQIAIDTIVISHNDRDHSGSLQDVLQQYPNAVVIGSNNRTCTEQHSWSQDGWNFKILSTDNTFLGNNNSCVVRVSNAKQSFLFTGDIEKKAEKYLIKKYGKQLKSDVLIVPHHGSNTSSSIEFLQVVDPHIALVSAGFQNPFNHPAPVVMKRYKELGITVYSTSCSGRIAIDTNTLQVSEYRTKHQKFYHRKCNKI